MKRPAKPSLLLTSAILLVGTSLLAFACIQEATTPTSGPPASVQIVSGDVQSGTVAAELPSPLVVKVVDSAGRPQAGQLVNFRVMSGGGSVFAGATLTSPSGVAQERWTLGTNAADSQRVEARAVDNVTGTALTYAVFNATALPGPPAHVAANGGDGQASAAGTAVAIPPSVLVEDRFQNPVPGVAVTFAVASGGGTITGASQTTTSDGVATVGSWTLGTTPGTNTLRVTVSAAGTAGALSVVTFTATGAPVLPPVGSCLGQTGPTITLSGVQTSEYDNTSLADSTKVDASAAQFLTPATIAIKVGGGANLCFHGGESIGHLPPSSSWSTMVKNYSMVPDGPGVTVEDLRTFDRGDGVAFGSDAPNWTLRRAYIHYARDGCVENHFVFSGTVDDALLDGCYIGFASRPYTTTQDGSDHVMTITRTLVRLQPMDGVYNGSAPGHGGFFEWSAISPKLSLRDNVFRADQRSNAGDEHMAPPPGKLADCSNNVMIWLGSGPFPEPLPSCFTVLTGVEGLRYWNDAVARWKADHPTTLPDVGPPIVSLFVPADSATLTGSVTLTATAADDRAVAGVQFQVDGQAIGSEVTFDSPPTKFTVSWDSRGVPNGTYTLTATARDAAGHTTTSAGITITVSN